MPTLYFSDGTQKDVDYGVASKIRKVLDGEEEPSSTEQEEFVARIVDISYEDLPSSKQREQFVIRKHDEVMDLILKDPNLRGRDKLKAVVERIKARRG